MGSDWSAGVPRASRLLLRCGLQYIPEVARAPQNLRQLKFSVAVDLIIREREWEKERMHTCRLSEPSQALSGEFLLRPTSFRDLS